jgi:serine/threonine-protein kinase
MNQAKYDWDAMWAVFEKLIVTPRNAQAQMISKACNQYPEMQIVLEQLLEAHYSQSQFLDEQPHWQADFEKMFTPPKVINGYVIEEKLGSGGIGEVYKASKQEDGFERQVAIKFATSGRFSEHVISSFNTELKILLSLNHPNIERLYDGGVTEDNIPFLIVEYIDGTHISHYCDQHQLTAKQHLKLFQKVCLAVDVVHRSLIVHRDIKASNIMIDADGEPKLLDFGLAKLADVESQNSSEINPISSDMMTLAYASPEQVKAESITTASDVYSLGILLYKLLTGNFPYVIYFNDIKRSQKNIVEKIPEYASKNINSKSEISKVEHNLKAKLSGELDQIISKALRKNAQERYLSAAQFSEDIQNYFDNKPVSAWHDSVLYRFKKFVKRHVLGFSMGMFATLSLIALSISLWIQSNNLKDSISAIETQRHRVMQVTDFLKGMFKISDPLITDTKIIKVKDLLDYSSIDLEDKFLNQPLTKATLYETLGNVYLNLSELDQAEELFKKASVIFDYEQDNAGILLIHLDKTRLYQQMGKFKLAQIELEKLEKNFDIIQLDKKTLADIEVFKGQNNYHLGHYKQAKNLLESALHKRKDLYEDYHESVVDVYQLLGNVYWRLGNFDKVAEYYQKSYVINKQNLGDDHHKTIKSKSALGVLAYSQGDYKKALEYFDSVAQSRNEKLGDSHILTAAAFNRLGATYFEASQFQLAELNLKKALNIYNKLKLDKSMKYARTLNNLGLIERHNRQYKKAQQTFEHVKQLELTNLGNKHMDLAGVNNNLGMVAADLGDFNQAIDYFLKAYQIQFDNNAFNNANIAFAMTNLGRMYMHEGELEMAQEWLDKALKLRTDKLGTNNLYRIETLSAKAELLIQQNRLGEAKKALINVITIREKELPKSDWRLVESKNLLETILYDGSSSAEKNLICSYQNLESKLGTNHYRVTQARLRLKELVILNRTRINCD